MRSYWLALPFVGAIAAAAEPPAGHLNFVGCPVVRDTQTVPCWLAEHEGELYYLGIQTDISADFDPPYLGHRVLVEGVLAAGPRICGGIVLDPVVVSPMIEFDANCNTILPEEPQYTVPFAPRPPGPSGGRLAFDPPPGGAAPAARNQAPPGEFTFYYDHGMLIMGRHAAVLTDIYNFSMQHDVLEIRIVGRAGGTLLSGGHVLEEDSGLALQRAREVADLLAEAGLHEVAFDVVADAPAEPDGRADWRRRSVSVVVETSPAAR